MYTPPHVGLLFASDAELRAVSVARVQAGILELPTGRIVACDILVNPETPPYANDVVAPGTYPVELLVNEGRPALAVLWLVAPDQRRTPDRWDIALLDGQDPGELNDDSFFGYPVDAGVGCFMDKSTAMLVERRSDAVAKDGGNYYDDVLADELEPTILCDHRPYADQPGNAIVFQSGWGDGVYPSYWGIVDEQPIALVTDFLVLD